MKDHLKTVTVKLESYAGESRSYWAREGDYFLSGRFGRYGPNLVMRIPMQMPKRLDGSGFVDLEHWFDFCPFLINGTTKEIPSYCTTTKAIAGRFKVRDYCGRRLNTFSVQAPDRAPHLLVGPIILPRPIKSLDLDLALRSDAIYLYPNANPDGSINACFVVIRFGERIDPITLTLNRSPARAKRDRTQICHEYHNWLAEELVKYDAFRPLDVPHTNLHRKPTQKFIRAIAELQSTVETINELSNLQHTLTLFLGGVIYNGELYYEKQNGLETLTNLIERQLSNALRAADNAREVVRIIKCLDVDNYLTYLHLELIHGPRFGAFILRSDYSSESLCDYTCDIPELDEYGELLSLPPEELAKKIWKQFLPTVLTAVIRFEQVKALQECDENYVKKHPRATPTRRIEPSHFLP
ncbi:hypothetical protein IJF89_00580 [Candidatus Saccharibacteria bacterium]|nr:hypothetical protein [Candidatus Saccharibacteria bacterium]